MSNPHKRAKNRKSREEQSQAQYEGYRRARTYLAGITDDADLEDEARIIYETFPTYPPDHFLETTSKRSRRMHKAFGGGDGWAFRLWTKLDEPYAYTLHADHLGLPPECSDPANFYCKKNVDRWKDAIKASFTPPLHWKLELCERVHLHLITDVTLACLILEQETCQPNLLGRVGHLDPPKPPLAHNARNLAFCTRASRQGNLLYRKWNQGTGEP